jgi:hypothetical protein
MKEFIVKINLLIVAANAHLKELGFSTSTIEKYDRWWARITTYMSRSGVRNYNRKVDQNYLEHLFQQFSYSNLSKRDKAIVRKVEYHT